MSNDVQDNIPVADKTRTIQGFYVGRQVRGKGPFAYEIVLRGDGGITSGLNTQTVAPGTAIPTSSPRLESYRVISTSPCGVKGVQVNTTSEPGWVMMFDSAYPPPDGVLAQPPVKYWEVDQYYTLDRDFSSSCGMISGATLVFSLTGPFVKTGSSTAVFSGESTVKPSSWVPTMDFRKSHNSMFIV